ncbi:MAG: hypothetical protein HYV15_04445, partial [Elusimicrobia bacterium]|nr:hypothetical protein [Elusimicrobiota bacterium]
MHDQRGRGVAGLPAHVPARPLEAQRLDARAQPRVEGGGVAQALELARQPGLRLVDPGQGVAEGVLGALEPLLGLAELEVLLQHGARLLLELAQVLAHALEGALVGVVELAHPARQLGALLLEVVEGLLQRVLHLVDGGDLVGRRRGGVRVDVVRGAVVGVHPAQGVEGLLVPVHLQAVELHSGPGDGVQRGVQAHLPVDDGVGRLAAPVRLHIGDVLGGVGERFGQGGLGLVQEGLGDGDAGVEVLRGGVHDGVGIEEAGDGIGRRGALELGGRGRDEALGRLEGQQGHLGVLVDRQRGLGAVRDGGVPAAAHVHVPALVLVLRADGGEGVAEVLQGAGIHQGLDPGDAAGVAADAGGELRRGQVVLPAGQRVDAVEDGVDVAVLLVDLAGALRLLGPELLDEARQALRDHLPVDILRLGVVGVLELGDLLQVLVDAGVVPLRVVVARHQVAEALALGLDVLQGPGGVPFPGAVGGQGPGQGLRDGVLRPFIDADLAVEELGELVAVGAVGGDGALLERDGVLAQHRLRLGQHRPQVLQHRPLAVDQPLVLGGREAGVYIGDVGVHVRDDALQGAHDLGVEGGGLGDRRGQGVLDGRHGGVGLRPLDHGVPGGRDHPADAKQRHARPGVLGALRGGDDDGLELVGIAFDGRPVGVIRRGEATVRVGPSFTLDRLAQAHHSGRLLGKGIG